jgi:hypothetical protein
MGKNTSVAKSVRAEHTLRGETWQWNSTNWRILVPIALLGALMLLAGCRAANGPPQLTITTMSLPNGAVGSAYNQTVQASGGQPPYSWSVSSGSLPAALALSSHTGAISGTPAAEGISNFTIQVGDSSSNNSAARRSFTLTITGPAPVITTTLLPNATVGSAYSQTLNATGGTGPYNWSVTNGTLPAGLVLSKAGVLSGTPTSAGTSKFTVQIADSSPAAQKASQALTLVVNASNPVPTITSLTPSQATAGLGKALELTIQGTGFIVGSTVSFGADAGLAPSSIDPQGTQILVSIPASDLANPGLVPVSVTNHPPGGGTSNQIKFSVSAPIAYGAGQILAEYPAIATAVDDAGDIVVVADPEILNASADVWRKDNLGAWQNINYLSLPTNSLASVAVSGDGNTIIVGDCATSGCVGHVFVYVAPPGGWPIFNGCNGICGLQSKAALGASNASAGTRFGQSIATDQNGDTIAVGAPCDYTTGQKLCGTVYVYKRPAGGWASKTEDAQLTIIGTATLGFTVAMDSRGQTIVAGLPGVEALVDTAGAAYVFVEPANGWATTSKANATLTASNGAKGDSLGSAVSISSNGTTVVAGAPYYPCQNCTNASFKPGPGAAYVFVNTSGPNGWASKTEDASLTASDAQNHDYFGIATAVNSDGSTIVAGAPFHPFTPPFNLGPGSAYVFQEGVGGWSGMQTETQHLLAFHAPDVYGCLATPIDNFANAGEVSLSSNGRLLAIGGHADLSPCSNGGEHVVYLFE